MNKLNKSVSIVMLIALSVMSQSSEAQGFRDRIKEKLKERIIKNQEEKPAPQTNANVDDKITKSGNYTLSFIHNGLTRMYKLHVPSKYSPETPTPLLVALHGGGGNMEFQATDKNYKLISKSDEAGFVVAFPNGYSRFSSGNFATWNAGKCCGQARDKDIDDVSFIKELVNKVTAQLNIDKKKIFAAGMSNGGMMSYRLACEMGETFKAIASVAGTDNTNNCNPKNPISILHIHAKNDDHVLFNGGAGVGLQRNKDQVTNFTSVPNTVAKWVKQDGCNETPKRVLEKTGAYCDLYSACKNNTQVQLCVTETGGHSWPGGEKSRASEAPSTAISANDVMWDFFKSK